MKTMRWYLPLAILTVVALGFVGGDSPVVGDDHAAGKAVFDSQKCSMCHTVTSMSIEAKVPEKMRGPDMGAAAAREADWLKKYLKKEVQLNDKDHKKAWKGTDEELDSLVRWIGSLPTE